MREIAERREGWGMSVEGVADVLYPQSVEDLRACFVLARERSATLQFTGAGRSYGDAALNDRQLICDMTRMNRILSFDEQTGHARLEAGVTLKQLSEYALPRGFWPPVVSGTRYTTLGGCISANVHGKNNFKTGPWGDHVLAIELMTPGGEILELSPTSNEELFRHVIGGFGMFGAIVSVTVKMKRVYSGRLKVEAFSCPNLDAIIRGFEQHNEAGSDYLVGWIDAFGAGDGLGRGQIHVANYFGEGEDPAGVSMVTPDDQNLPERFFLVVPKSWMWWLAKPLAFRLGMKVVNTVRYWWGSLDRNQHHFLQTHTAFNHLLDYVPSWKRFYQPGGLIQYQIFAPKEHTRRVFGAALSLAQDVGLEPWLVVMKRHRNDDYPLSHAVDGYSLAMDFAVTDANRESLFRLCERYNELVTESDGRFYFAKDQVVGPRWVLRAWGDAVFSRMFALKDQVDPEGLIGGSLWRRVFAPLRSELKLLSEHPEEPDTVVPLPEGDKLVVGKRTA